jgi:hypothetical protein
MLRVVTWNMNHAFRSLELRDRAWAYLAETVHPDIALLQEGCRLTEYRRRSFAPAVLATLGSPGPESWLGFGNCILRPDR